MLQSASTTQVFGNIKLSMHKDLAAAACTYLTENPAPNLSWARSYCKIINRPRVFTDVICVRAGNCNLCYRQAPSSNQNKPTQVKVKVREQRKEFITQSHFLARASGWTFPRSSDTFCRFQWKPEACKDCRTLPRFGNVTLSIWHNCLWHLENNLQNMVRTPQFEYNNYSSKMIFILY